MATDGPVNRFNGVAFAAGDERLLDTPLLTPGPASAPFSARGGRRVNGSGLAVSVSGSPEAWSVTPGAGVIFGAGQPGAGGWRFAIASAKGATMPARPGAGLTRVDRVIARIYDTDVLQSGPKELKIELVTGTPATSNPQPADLPSSAMWVELARLTVPATGTISVTQSTARTVAAGGILPATAAELDAMKSDGTAFEGMHVDVATKDHLRRFDGTAWMHPAPPLGRWASGLNNRDTVYLKNSGNICGPFAVDSSSRAGGSMGHFTAQISAYAGTIGQTSLQDCTHVLEVQIASGAWIPLESKTVTNRNVAYVPLGATLSGWIAFDPAAAVAARLVTNVAGGTVDVGVAGINISATFF